MRVSVERCAAVSLMRRLRHAVGVRRQRWIAARCFEFVIVVVLLCGTAGGPASAQDRAAGAIAQRQRVMVKLFGAGVGNLDSYGSGVVVSPEGHVITVWNHLINVGYLTAVTADGGKHAVQVVGTDAAHDLAVLRLEAKSGVPFPFLDLSEAGEAEAGEPVLAFSNMFHVATGNEPVSVLHGIVAARATLQADQGRWTFPVREPVYIIDAVTNNSGSTGGLLTRPDGTPLGLIGREVRHSDNRMWVNYAVPLVLLRPAIDRILSGRPPENPASATEPRPLLSDRQLTQRFGLTLVPDVLEKTPAYIDQVASGSPAAVAQLRRGDLIVLLDDQAVTSVTDVRQHLAAVRSGQRVVMTVNRAQQLVTTEIRVP